MVHAPPLLHHPSPPPRILCACVLPRAVINVAILVFVVILGSTKIDTYNYTHFSNVPDKQPQGFVPHGAGSILSAAGTVFFSYLGFDMVSSMAEEVAKPQRDLPIGIVGSLAIAGV